MDYFFCSICQNTCILTNININEKAKLDDSNTELDQNNNYKKYCNNCNIFNFIIYNTILFKEERNLSKRIPNISHNERLLSLINYCDKCNKKTLFKMFIIDKNDLKQNYICTECKFISS